MRSSPTTGSDAQPSAQSSIFRPSAATLAQSYAPTLNAYATSGPADVYDLTTDQTVLTLPPLDITTFRDTYGFSSLNSDYGLRMDDSMEDELLGSDETNIDVLGWQVRKPEAVMYEQITNNHIPGGICFGMAFSSLEFYDFPSERTLFAPAPGLDDPWSAYVLNHPEYETETLRTEYLRDRAVDPNTQPPLHYFPDNDPDEAAGQSWRHTAQLYANWVKLVYEATPFDRARIPTPA